MNEPTPNERPVAQKDYLEHAVPIIRQYLDSDKSFTTTLLQLTHEQDIEALSKTLGKQAKKFNIPMDKLEAFLNNKDYLPDYPALKAKREEKEALSRNQMNNFFQPFLASITNAKSSASINETRDTAIARLSKEIHELTEQLRLKSLELNELVNTPENEIDNRPSSNMRP